MSFLENSIDKPPVVLDIGHVYTKCGFAGDHGPKCIIKSEIHRNGDEINIFSYKNENELKEYFMEFMYRIYYKILNINSRDRKVIIVESILNPNNIRKILSDILFKNFQVISLFFMPSHLASLYSLGINTALVIDCGYEDIQIMPIAEYYLMTGLFEYTNNSSKIIYKKIEEKLEEAKIIMNGNEKSLNESNFKLNKTIIEDIAIRTCFVTDITRSRNHFNNQPTTTNNCNYYLPNNMVLNIPGSIREFSFESIFTDSIDSQGLANIILDVILKSPIDLRKRFADNIVLIGGTCMITGFKSRLVAELNDLIKNDNRYESLKSINEFKFHIAPCYENYTAWLGASIFSTLEVIDTLSVQNIKYKDNNACIPDWFVLSSKFKNYDEVSQTIN